METSHFLTWFLYIAAIVGIGLGAMLWAYRGSGSVAVLFRDPVQLSVALTEEQPEAKALFQAGISRFQAGKYRQAADKFSQVIQHLPELASAYHNRGLALANLRQDNEAVTSLVKAADLYLENDDQTAFQTLRDHLELLKTSRTRQ